MSVGSNSNVMLSVLEAVGEDICIQVLKLSDDNWIEPEQEVFEVFVVIVVVSIASEKVTEIDAETDTEDAESVGEDEETVGAVLSGSVLEGGKDKSSPFSLTSLLQPKKKRIINKIKNVLMTIYPN